MQNTTKNTKYVIKETAIKAANLIWCKYV